MKKILKILRNRKWRQYKEDKLCADWLKDRKKILDIGCGIGRFMSWFDPGKIQGIDINDFSLGICKEKGLEVKKMDALNMNFSEKFDAIHCSHIVEHFNPHELHGFIKSIDNILLPGGILIIRTPLLWNGFYDNLTHVRPYNPLVFINYLTGNNAQQKTRETISGNYSVEKIVYRRLPLVWISNPKNKPLAILRRLFDILAYLHLSSFKKDAYVIIFKKHAAK